MSRLEDARYGRRRDAARREQALRGRPIEIHELIDGRPVAMAPVAPNLRSSAWASLIQEQTVEVSVSPIKLALARTREECRTARAGMATAFATADQAQPAPA